jgi:hypothetical protein
MQHIAVLSQPKLVVAPVSVARYGRIELKPIPKHLRVPEFNVTIMMSTQQPDTEGRGPLFVTRPTSSLRKHYFLQPGIVWASMIIAVVVPLRCCQTVCIPGKVSTRTFEILPVPLECRPDVSVALLGQDERHGCLYA